MWTNRVLLWPEQGAPINISATSGATSVDTLILRREFRNILSRCDQGTGEMITAFLLKKTLLHLRICACQLLFFFQMCLVVLETQP